MYARKPSALLSQSREVSEIHFCFQGLLLVEYFSNLVYDTDLLCHVQSAFDDVALISKHLPHLTCRSFPVSIRCFLQSALFRTSS